MASGAYDIALALGVEKLKDTGYGGLPEFSHVIAGGTKLRVVLANNTTPGMFAIMATRYFSHYKLTPEEGKKTLAKISVKSHHNGALHEKAHMRREVTVEQVVAAPIIARPLGLFDCWKLNDELGCERWDAAKARQLFREIALGLKASGANERKPLEPFRPSP